MRQPLVAGNWKLQGSDAFLKDLLTGLSTGLGAAPTAEILVAPPFVYLPAAAAILADSPIKLAAQNMNQHEKGAYTGEVSAAMLKEVGCEYVIIGHSERREYYHETSEAVAEKCAAAVSAGLKPIVCIGESLATREANQTEAWLADQLAPVLALSDESLTGLVMAYEPIWAIGTGETASPEQAQAVHEFIRSKLNNRSAELAETTRILYGGSVKAHNAAALFSMSDIDGGLIGGASLDSDSFLSICEAV